MKQIEIFIATHKEKIESDTWHTPIQVGAENSTIDLQEVKDNIGENISYKNSSYCELTALYWIWRNSTTKVVGLEHYRRRFHITQEKICQILAEYDMIVPSEYFYRCSLEGEYCRFHLEEDWMEMKKILLEEFPEYEEAVKEVFSNNALIPYNMFIAEKKICDDYCSWLFPIMDKLEEHVGERTRDSYQSRYIGFLSERLFTLYIKKNQLKLYVCPVEEREHQNIGFVIKNWVGQHVWNPLIFKMKRKEKNV